ncbi:MAG: bifunctional heptose 7-phosphate kinase/heptose 1-phosphate adenyltransferase [Terriglobia bacterium]
MTEKERIRWKRIIRSFDGQSVGVLGDFMLDELLWGEATRISPEAPVPVVLVEPPGAAQGFPGGAGNVAANIAALGGRAIPWGVIGADESGRRLCALLAGHGIRPETLVRESGRITPRKLRIAAHQHQLLRLDFERVSVISTRSRAALARSLRRRMERLGALIVSDYQKGSVDPELCKQVLPLARARRVPVFVDPKPSHPDPCYHATAVTPNLHEAEQLAGIPMRDRESLQKGGRRLIEKFACEYLLVTRGSDGMSLFDAKGGHHEIHSRPRPVYDVTGAGDTVIAALALAFSAGASMREAAEIANLAAGRVVLKFGTAGISREELLGAVTAE